MTDHALRAIGRATMAALAGAVIMLAAIAFGMFLRGWI